MCARPRYNQRVVDRRRFEKLALALLGLTLLVVLWGAVVRVTGSGAGCADHWPLCNGVLLPRAPAVATLIELTHRLTSGIVGLLALLVGVLAFRTFPAGSPVRRAAGLSLFLMVVESLIGALLVKKGLVAQDRSEARAFVVALHLCNTFLLIGAQLVTYRLSQADVRLAWRGRAGHVGLLALMLALVLLLGASGAVTALGDTLFPAESLRAGMAEDFSPGAHFLVRLRVLHPLLAVVSSGVLVYLAQHLRAAHGKGTVSRWATVLTATLVAQLAVGALNLGLLAPAGIQLAHLLGADATWLCVVELLVAVLSAPALAASAETRASSGASGSV